jgi:hypothetical protein
LVRRIERVVAVGLLLIKPPGVTCRLISIGIWLPRIKGAPVRRLNMRIKLWDLVRMGWTCKFGLSR